MKRSILSFLTALVFAMSTMTPIAASAQQSFPLYPNIVAGRYLATSYGSYRVASLNAVAAASASMTLDQCFVEVGTNGRFIFPFTTQTPLIVVDGANTETVTPSAVTSPTASASSSVNAYSCSFTATFANAHSAGVKIVSGSQGLWEAIQDAFTLGGGVVVLSPDWGGTTALISTGAGYPNVLIEDLRGTKIRYWTLTPSGSTVLATPTALTAQAACDATHTFCSDATVAGTWTSGTVFGCVSYVDAMGNEGPCSTTASFTSVVSKAIDVAAPAASTGAVGYTLYLSLVGGSYAFAYQVPITSTICTLTKVETITPACAVTNTNYNQTGSNSQVAAITVNTSPLALQAGVASTTTDYVGNTNSRTTYAYAPGSGPAIDGIQASSLVFTVGPATVASTVPQVIGTLAVPAGYMNQVGKTIRVCGKIEMTNASASIEAIQLWWDGAGSNAAGVPVKIANVQVGGTGTAVAYNGAFCWTGHTTVAGTGVTAGSIQGDASSYYLGIASAPVGSFTPGTDTFTAATGSLNLAGGAGFTSRLHIVQLHTTGTDVSPQLMGATVEVLN